MENEGYEHLVNLEGGFHGAPDETGQIAQPGWLASGFDVAQRAEPGRTWEELAQA